MNCNLDGVVQGVVKSIWAVHAVDQTAVFRVSVFLQEATGRQPREANVAGIMKAFEARSGSGAIDLGTIKGVLIKRP